MNKLLLLIAIIALIALAAFGYTSMKKSPSPGEIITSFEECAKAGYPVMESYPAQCKTPHGETFTQDIGNEMEMSSKIRIDSPRPHQTIKSPLVITGEAVGGWYFEAVFPIDLVDANGEIIAQHYAQAQGEWMTENFVPFTSTLQFATPSTPTGTLILRKDNPSGLPENEADLRIPVRFDTAAPTSAVKVFFSNAQGNEPMLDCAAVESVTHYIPKTEGVARAALIELIAGPTQQELASGYTSSLPKDAGIKIQDLRIEKGTAYVDFSAELDRGVAGSCRTTNIRAQIENTLKQFSTITDVIISIDGRTEDILQP